MFIYFFIKQHIKLIANYKIYAFKSIDIVEYDFQFY